MTKEEFVWCIIGFIAGWIWGEVFGAYKYIRSARAKGKLPPGY